MLVPQFGLFLNLLGALTGTALVFIMPATIYNRVYKDEITCVRKVMHFILLLFGCVVGLIASTISLFELIEALGYKLDKGSFFGADSSDPNLHLNSTFS